MDLVDLAGGIARDLATALLGAGMFVAAVLFVTRRPTGARQRRRRRDARATHPAVPAAASTVALARARAATRRAEDPRPAALPGHEPPAEPARIARSGPSDAAAADAVSAMVVHLAETNPRFLAQVLSAWINDEVPERDRDPRSGT